MLADGCPLAGCFCLYKNMKPIRETYTFDDVLLLPRRSAIFSRKDVSLRSQFSKNIFLDVPIVSANMDTVTEAAMASAMAEAGSLGIIHRFLTIERQAEEVRKVKQKNAKLLVGAALGVKEDAIDRARALLDAGVDVLVVDIAHGHNERALDTVRMLKQRFLGCEVVGGNVATAAGAHDLIHAGVDGIKVGIGPGAACITRIVTGVGVPQLSAIMDTAAIAKKYRIPIIADGGIRNSGDVAKALAAGASSIMAGSLFAGTDEAPGASLLHGDVRYKAYRGMASAAAAGWKQNNDFYRSPEGTSGEVPYRGTAQSVVDDFASGLRSSMSYMGARTIPEFQKNAEFVRITHASLTESHSHDMTIK